MKQLLIKVFLLFAWIAALATFLLLAYFPPQLFKDLFPVVFIPLNALPGTSSLSKLMYTLLFVTIISIPVVFTFWLTFYSGLWEKIITTKEN